MIRMKSYLPLIFSFLCLVSCSQQPQPEPQPEPEPVFDSTWFYVTAPTFSDGSIFEWKEGDKITICEQKKNAELYTVTAVSSGQKARFKGNFPKTLKKFKAFYPAYRAISSSAEANILINCPQSYSNITNGMPREALQMTFYGDKLFDGFSMTPVAAMVKVNIGGNDIKAVSFTFGTSTDYYLSGDQISLNCSTYNTSKGTSNVQTLKPAGTSPFSPGTYCFCLVTKADTRSAPSYSISYTKSGGSVIKREFNNVISLSRGCVCEIPGDENTVVLTGTKVSGTVKDAVTGKALAGIPVSDGINFVKTDDKGAYSFTSDLTKAQNVFVVMPSGYEFDTNGYGGWNNHKFLDVTKTAQQIDFSLKPRTLQTDKYRLLVLGDPQQMSSRQYSLISWPLVCNAIKDYVGAIDQPLYMISLGDMVTNEIEVPGMAEKYLDIQKITGLCTFCTPGNHDHVQAATTYYPSVIEFSRWFGPYNYSFNLGKQHFIFLDSCAWGEGGDDAYHSSLNEQSINYLEKDLATVDKSTPVHIFTHCPLTKKQAGVWPTTNKYESRMMQALVGRKVEFWYGHIHTNVNYSLTAAEIAKYAPGVVSLGSHIVARCGGTWDCSQEICTDGSPRGWLELDIDGTSSTWDYHSIEEKYPNTMKAYAPGQFKGEGLAQYDETALYVNVYSWDNSWSTPQVTIGGTTSDMTKVTQNKDAAYDPMYQHF